MLSGSRVAYYGEMSLQVVFQWFLENMHWLFSGVGVTGVTALAWWWKSRFPRVPSQCQQAGAASQNIQAGGNVTVTNNPRTRSDLVTQEGDTFRRHKGFTSTIEDSFQDTSMSNPVVWVSQPNEGDKGGAWSPGRREMRPSIPKILWSDLASLLCLIAPAVVLVLAIEDRFVGVLGPILTRGRSEGGEAHTFFFSVAPVLAGASLLLLLLRLRVFLRCFAGGVVVPGVVTAVPVARDRGTLRYRYLFEGREFKRSNLVHRSTAVRRLRPGASVEVVVQRDRPSRAFVKQLYSSEPAA